MRSGQQDLAAPEVIAPLLLGLLRILDGLGALDLLGTAWALVLVGAGWALVLLGTGGLLSVSSTAGVSSFSATAGLSWFVVVAGLAAASVMGIRSIALVLAGAPGTRIKSCGLWERWLERLSSPSWVRGRPPHSKRI